MFKCSNRTERQQVLSDAECSSYQVSEEQLIYAEREMWRDYGYNLSHAENYSAY
jgi:hypothetical protein